MSEENNIPKNELSEIEAIISNADIDNELQSLIDNAPLQQDMESSGLMEKVVDRSYATDPVAQLDKITNQQNDVASIENEVEIPVPEKKPFFQFLKREEPVLDNEESSSIQDTSTPMMTDIPSVPGIQFREAIDPNMSATENVATQLGSTTSDFIWRNFKQGFPEIMGSYVVNISDSVADDPLVPSNLSNQIKEEIGLRNAENRNKLEIPQWHEDNIKPALESFCIEKGIQTSIPTWVQLLIGVGFLVTLFVIPTVMEIKKSNKAYLNRLDSLFDEFKKDAKKNKESQKSTETEK